MDGKMLARLGAVVFVTVAIIATAIELTRQEKTPEPPAPRVIQLERDPLREGQRRCQQLGEAATRDGECLRIWAETRERFLGRASAAPPAADGR